VFDEVLRGIVAFGSGDYLLFASRKLDAFEILLEVLLRF
jgi:hypothetical protein